MLQQRVQKLLQLHHHHNQDHQQQQQQLQLMPPSCFYSRNHGSISSNRAAHQRQPFSVRACVRVLDGWMILFLCLLTATITQTICHVLLMSACRMTSQSQVSSCVTV
jgi:hypothetical protein